MWEPTTMATCLFFCISEVKASINTGEQRSPIFQGQRVFFTLARFVQAAPAIFTQYYRQQQYLHGVCVEGGGEGTPSCYCAKS